MSTQKIDGNITDAIAELNKYPNLSQIISQKVLSDKVSEKYPTGAELKKDDVHDLYTALLYARIYPHSGNAASPESMLVTMNHCIPLLNLSDSEKKKMAHKFMQLRTTAFWDTFSEICISAAVKQTMPASRVEMEYKFEPSRGRDSKDADVALLNNSGTPIALVDVYTPKKKKDHFIPTLENVTQFVSGKYDSKFAEHCGKNPKERVIVVVAVIENESIYMLYPMKIVANQVGQLLPSLGACKGLIFAQLCTFRCPDSTTKLLVVDTIAKFEGKIT